MSDVIVSLSETLRELARWRRVAQLSFVAETEEGTAAFVRLLDMCAVEAESLEQQLAVARRWGPGTLEFGDVFERHQAILAGVRAGRVIDLVPVLEREMARNAALNHGGAHV